MLERQSRDLESFRCLIAPIALPSLILDTGLAGWAKVDYKKAIRHRIHAAAEFPAETCQSSGAHIDPED